MRMLTLALIFTSLMGIFPTVSHAAEKPVTLAVKITDAEIDPFLTKFGNFLRSCSFFYLATCEGNKPYVRPVGFTAFIDNQLPIATSTKKEMYRQMMANPEIDLSATLPDRSAFVRFHGKATLSKDQALFQKFVSSFPIFKKMYGDSLVLFLVKPDRAGIFPMKKGQKPETKTFTEAK